MIALLAVQAAAHGLHLPLDGTEMRRGVAFEVIAVADVEIEGFGVHLATTARETFDVWMCDGSWEGRAEGEWRRVGEVTAFGAGWGFSTFLPLPAHVNLPAGTRASFYLEGRTSARLLVTRGTDPGSVVGEAQGVVQVLEGAAFDANFRDSTPGRRFNGELYYRGGSTQLPSVAAQDLETPAGTPLTIALGGFSASGVLEHRIVEPPAHGTLSPVRDGVTVYAPDEGYVGPDGFTVTVFEGAVEAPPVRIAVQVTWAAPENLRAVADPGGPYVGEEGAPITLDASASYDPDGDLTAFAWDCDGDGADDHFGPTVTCAWPDDGEYAVRLRVVDRRGDIVAGTTTVTLANATPRVVVDPPGPVAVGAAVTLRARGLDAGSADVLRYTWNLDGEKVDGATVTRTFAPGRHVVSVTVEDDDGGIAVGGTIVQVGP